MIIQSQGPEAKEEKGGGAGGCEVVTLAMEASNKPHAHAHGGGRA